MAIPFFEPNTVVEASAEQQNIDQVDGPVASHQSESLNNSHESSPSMPATMAGAQASSSGSSTSTPSSPSTTSSDELAWRTLAVAMCKVLKEHYNHTAQQNNKAPITGAVVQISPDGQVNPIWK